MPEDLTTNDGEKRSASGSRRMGGSAPARLRVFVDARLTGAGELGGVEQFVVGLAEGLSNLEGDGEEYLFLCAEGEDEWLRPHLSGPCRVLHGAGATRQPAWAGGLRRLPLAGTATRRLLRRAAVSRWGAGRVPLPRSDGTVERAGADIIHFPTQSAFLTGVPSIYHPWDLQHLHLPQFFTPEVIRKREAEYRAFCEQARMVAVATVWHKRDLMERYGLPDELIQVVSPAPAIAPSDDDDASAARAKFSLPPRFIYYPAQTWAHKNHMGLLEALALLRDREGLVVFLVSSGRMNEFYPEIERRARELDLLGQIKFVGFVSPAEVQSLYRLSRAMIFPTLFEGFGLPIVEAFRAGAPVACSNVTSLPHVAGDAALIFDPLEVGEIAGAVARLWTDDELCRTLASRGTARARAFTWEHTSRTFRAHYRRLAGRALSQEDHALLSRPPAA